MYKRGGEELREIRRGERKRIEIQGREKKLDENEEDKGQRVGNNETREREEKIDNRKRYTEWSERGERREGERREGEKER